ncbi:MAG: hypothetical protein ABI305_02235 [Tepidiformaceae bacterium]
MSKAHRFLRLFRGLALGLSLSFCNLVGAFLTLLVLGGLGSWSGTQFVGFFGLMELATGVAFIFGPNAWHLPVVAAETRPGENTHLSLSILRIPHWAGGVKSIAGAGCLMWAGSKEGVGPGSIAIFALALCVFASCMAVSVLVARWGVAHPEHDVFQFILKRPKHEDRLLPAVSVSALALEALFNIGPFPFVKAFPPTLLYSPELVPSRAFLLWVAGITLLLVGAALVVWWGRFSFQAPREQQRHAEEVS